MGHRLKTLEDFRSADRIALLFRLLGGLALAVALFLVVPEIHLLRHGVRTTAVLLPPSTQLAGEADSSRFPVFAFVAEDGSPQLVRATSSSSAMVMGSSIEIIYDPRSPSDTTATDFASLYLAPIVLLSISTAGFGFGQVFRSAAKRGIARLTAESIS